MLRPHSFGVRAPLSVGAARTRLLVVVLALITFSAPALGELKAAAQHYQRAIALVDQGDLAAARGAFELAYAESPHYLVLYNLGKVCLDLGQKEEAARYFERYLEEGGSEIPPAQRTEVESTLASLGPTADEKRSAVPSDNVSNVSKTREPTRRAAPPLGAQLAAPRSAPEAALEPVEATRPPTQQLRKIWALAAGASGVVLMASGGTLLAVNAGRRSEQQAELERLQNHPAPDTIANQTDLDDYAAWVRAAGRYQAELAATRRLDVAALTTLGVGAALAVTGVVLYVWPGNDTSIEVQGRKVGLRVHF